MNKLCAAAIATFCVAAPTCAHANDDLDTSWNGTGTVLMPVSGYNVGDSEATGSIAALVQPDGRILLAGMCTASATTMCMARLQPSGLRDYSFGPDQTGVFAFPRFPSWPTSSLFFGLARQSDGRILVTGFADGAAHDDPNVYAAVTRLTANGALDPSTPAQPFRFPFWQDADDPSTSVVTAAAVQADGKLVVAGFTARGGNFDFAVARLRTDLSLDPTFNGTGVRPGVQVAAFDLGGGDIDLPLALAIQRDGKIVVAGIATTVSNGEDAAVLRLNADGTPDDTFGNVGRATFDFHGHHLNDEIGAVRIDAQGRIWIAGAYQYADTDSDFLVARLRANGTLDTDYCNGNGYKTVFFDLDTATSQKKTDSALSLLLQSDGKVVLAGSASNGAADGRGYDFAAARLLPNCNLDNTFGTDGKLHGRFGTQPFSHVTAAGFGGSGIVLAGYGATNYEIDTAGDTHTLDGQFGVAMLRLDLIFANGFEP